MASEEGVVIACHTKADFDAQMAKGAGKLVIIDFMTTWCSGCKLMAPVYAEFANKYPAALFLEVNAEELEEIAKEHVIHSVPTFFFIRHGEPIEGLTSTNPDELEDAIKKYHVAGTTPATASA